MGSPAASTSSNLGSGSGVGSVPSGAGAGRYDRRGRVPPGDLRAPRRRRAARLVYADWLDERGDARGEFIRVQCQLARLRNNDPARSELQEREGYLLSVARCGEWDEPLRALGASPSSYERGFPTVVAMPAEDFLRHGEEVLRHVPRPTAYLTVGSGDTAQLARSPLLAGLRGLGIEHEGVTEGDAQAIATSPHLKQLTRLTLPNNHIRDDGAINLTHAGLQRHRVLWVREMTEEEIRQVGEKGPTIDSIQVAEFESHDVLKEWLKEKAPAFLPRTTAG